MSTNCYITVKVKDDLYKTVYCHWDGYPSYTGKMLLNYYNSKEKALAIIELGDLSFLDKSIECPLGHSFDRPIKGYSVFYGRDGGETDVKPEIDFNCPKYKSEYHYVWDGKWFCNGKELK